MKRLRPFLGILLIAAVGAGLLVYQRHHVRRHLPLIAAGVATAERDGPEILGEVGVPPGSVPKDDGTRTFPAESRRSMWHGTRCRLRWERTWVVPGDHDTSDAWFHDHLTERGWRLFTRGVPSTVEKLYWKDRWLVTIQRRADFSTDRDPTVHKTVVLEWDYWHDFE